MSMVSRGFEVVGDDLGHQQGDFVGRVELARFLARIRSEFLDEIFVDETKDIVALPSIHRDLFDQLN